MTTEAAFRKTIIQEGLSKLGHLYRDSSVPTNWPPQQFDCSVFTHWCASKAGINIDSGTLSGNWPQPEPHPWHKYQGYTGTQKEIARRLGAVIPFSQIKPGDFLYYDKPGGGHVVIYLGGGKIVHAAGSAYGVILSPVVGPGQVGHGGKTLTMCVSVTKLAKACGFKFTANPKPPVPVKPPKPQPVGLPGVAVKNVQPGDKNGQVLLVQKALRRTVGLDYSSGPGVFGPKTTAAYAEWQRSLGYHGSDADGHPGTKSLTALGKRTGLFKVV